MQDSEYWRILLSSIDFGDLLVKLIEEAWDPEDVDEAEGETEPAESKCVDILREDWLFIDVETYEGEDPGKEYVGEDDNGGGVSCFMAISCEKSFGGVC